MSTNETYDLKLITRYFSGEATPEEIRELSKWIKSDPANAVAFTEYRKSWLAVTAIQVDEQMDIDQEWDELQMKITPVEPALRSPIKSLKIPFRKRKPEYTIPSIEETTEEETPEQPLQAFELPPVVEETSEVIRMEPEVMKPDGIDWRIGLIRAATIAAIVLVLLVPTWIVYRYFTTADVTKIMATNEVMETIMPDGTIITLNAYSSISYTEDFGKETREVEVNGECYFDVARDSIQPFILSSGNTRIEVLGTAFYINTLKNGTDVEVILVDGSLSVYFEDIHGERKTIIPGEKAELIQANQRIVVIPNEDPNFLAWKTRRMIFLDDRLDVIIKTLNKVYQTDIRLGSQGLAACRLTASFNRQSLESVLSVIQATLELSVEATSSEIILYGAGCN